MPSQGLQDGKSSHETSPWPTWSAATLHAMDVSVVDYRPFDGRTQLHELREEKAEGENSRD